MRRLFAALVMVLAFGGVALADDWAACFTPPDGDPGPSILACTNIILAGKESRRIVAIAYVNRGVAYRKMGNYDRAIADYDKAIQLNPDDADAYYDRGIAYRKMGNYDRAIADYDKTIQLMPDDADAFFNRGLAYDDKGDYDRAIADYDKVIELNPDNARAYYNRGTGYIRKSDFVRAIDDFDRAIQLSPNYGRAYFNRGIAYDGRDDTKALRDYRMAVLRLAASDTALRSQASLRVAELEKQLVAIGSDPGRRVALVIGNGAYQSVPQLVNPTNDAKLIADALRQDGFDVTPATDNLSREGLINALKAFAIEADNADWAVVYFAGHGIEMGGTNYLIPVDARLETDRDVGLEAVPLDQVMSAIEGARFLRLVILDACRNNPFAATIKRTARAGRDIGRGLGRVEPAQATLVAYSAKDGSIAADGDGANSPYATALAAHLIEPGVEVDKLFRLVRDDVLDATGKKQEPFVYGSLPGRQDFYFQPASPGMAVTNGGAPQRAADEAAWQRIQSSTDPVVFESFGQFFPDSAHTAEAVAKAKSLRETATSATENLDQAAAPSSKNSDRLLDAETPPDKTVHLVEPPPAPLVASAGDDADVANSLVAQKAMLFEEPLGATGDAGNNVLAINATISWRYVENGANGPEIVADLQVPERNMKVKLSIHKNADKSLPASHLVEIQIDAPADLPGKSVEKVPRFVMKPTEEAHGQPLVGIDAKITAGYFWIALSGANADLSANLALLRELDWIDLPFVYETGQRAILTFEKGTAGERVFQRAMAAWSRG